MPSKVWKCNGPKAPVEPGQSVAAFDFAGPGTVICFSPDHVITQTEYDALSKESKAKVDKLVADGFFTVSEEEEEGNSTADYSPTASEKE